MWGFRDNVSHQIRSDQISPVLGPPKGCAALESFDWYSDGISAPGDIKLTYDGEVVCDSGDFGFGEVFRFGDGS
jgi:hypothetical protein